MDPKDPLADPQELLKKAQVVTRSPAGGGDEPAVFCEKLEYMKSVVSTLQSQAKVLTSKMESLVERPITSQKRSPEASITETIEGRELMERILVEERKKMKAREEAGKAQVAKTGSTSQGSKVQESFKGEGSQTLATIRERPGPLTPIAEGSQSEVSKRELLREVASRKDLPVLSPRRGPRSDYPGEVKVPYTPMLVQNEVSMLMEAVRKGRAILQSNREEDRLEKAVYGNVDCGLGKSSITGGKSPDAQQSRSVDSEVSPRSTILREGSDPETDEECYASNRVTGISNGTDVEFYEWDSYPTIYSGVGPTQFFRDDPNLYCETIDQVTNDGIPWEKTPKRFREIVRMLEAGCIPEDTILYVDDAPQDPKPNVPKKDSFLPRRPWDGKIKLGWAASGMDSLGPTRWYSYAPESSSSTTVAAAVSKGNSFVFGSGAKGSGKGARDPRDTGNRCRTGKLFTFGS